MAEWFMFVRVENFTGIEEFDSWEHLATIMSPVDIDFAFLDERPSAINAWAEDRWGAPIGPYARVWSISSLTDNERWIGKIMDRWARG